MKTIISDDGTRIAYYRGGAGHPLVLVPGTGAANPVAWTGVVPALEERFQVYAVDRRGHGESGDSPSYALEREFEDIAAVVNSIGEPVHLLGHSFGALCALEGALLTSNVQKLILYEPWISPTGLPMIATGLIERFEALLDAGDREGALTLHYLENVGMTPQEVEAMKSSPAWASRLASAHTLPREMRAEEHYRFDGRRFMEMKTSTLLLHGGESPQTVKDGMNHLLSVLPNSQIAIMAGQEHIAMYTSPQLFLQEVFRFLLEPG
jgi:pimeloyl-ACP methyl ester carboxylesterase